MYRSQFAEKGATEGYGIGFAISDLEGHRLVRHGGAIYGFATELAFLPDEKLVFNRNDQGVATEVVAAGVLFRRRPVGTEEGETFRIKPLRPVEELRKEAIAARPPREEGDFREPELVEIARLDPSIKLDIRYAGTNNFMGASFYREPRAFTRTGAATRF
jgi:hypothetical protein